jgi:hypothetical protein
MCFDTKSSMFYPSVFIQVSLLYVPEHGSFIACEACIRRYTSWHRRWMGILRRGEKLYLYVVRGRALAHTVRQIQRIAREKRLSQRYCEIFTSSGMWRHVIVKCSRRDTRSNPGRLVSSRTEKLGTISSPRPAFAEWAYVYTCCDMRVACIEGHDDFRLVDSFRLAPRLAACPET